MTEQERKERLRLKRLRLFRRLTAAEAIRLDRLDIKCDRAESYTLASHLRKQMRARYLSHPVHCES